MGTHNHYSFYDTVNFARQAEWRYRIQNELDVADLKQWHSTFYTLTFAEGELTHDWTPVRNWLRQCRRRVRTIIEARNIAADEMALDFDPKSPHETLNPNPILMLAYRKKEQYPCVLRYICVTEYGSKTKRLHYHLILITPVYLRYRDWPGWTHGYTHHKVLSNKDKGASYYITKYITKEEKSRCRCNYNFGLMTLITLLTNSNFQLLILTNLRMAQRLLQSLSTRQRRNYPTSTTIRSWLSLTRSLDTLRYQTTLLPTPLVKMTGEQNFVNKHADPNSSTPAVTPSVAPIIQRIYKDFEEPWGLETSVRRNVPGLYRWKRYGSKPAADGMEPSKGANIEALKERYRT